jgi:hypothetical protein
MVLSRVAFVLVIGATLPGCGTDRHPDPRPPAEIAAPSPGSWRALARDLAHDLAHDLARGAAERGAPVPAVLASIDGGAPAYFRDLLLAGLLDRGLRIAATGDAPLRIECRTTPLGVLPMPRGIRGRPAAAPGEILVLCLLARDGAYIAAARGSLPVPARPEPPAGGIVIGVTG